MSQSARSIYAGYRFPPEIIGHAVSLYFRFPLSLRMVEEMLAARGIVVSHETVRQWALRFGQAFANEIRRRLPRLGNKWHLDEVVIKIAGTTHWLWRAVDQHGVVLDVLVQSRRDARGAKRLLRKLLKRQRRAPRVMITDKLASYSAAKKDLMPGVEHRRHKGLNNRAENSHQPTRRRERQMKRFKSQGQAQRFLSAHDPINKPLARTSTLPQKRSLEPPCHATPDPVIRSGSPPHRHPPRAKTHSARTRHRMVQLATRPSSTSSAGSYRTKIATVMLV